MKNTQIEWIGNIPEDWEVKPISTCFKERNEKVSDYEWEPLSVTKQGIVKQLETAAKSDAHDARKKVCKNDFVINSRSDRKQSCGVSPYDGSVSLINIVLENRKLNPKFVNYLLKNYGFAEEFYRYGSGIVADLWSTNYQKMKKIMIPIPPKENQQKIANFLDEKVLEIDKIIEKTKETIEDYKKYKKSIITEIIMKGSNKTEQFKETKIDWMPHIPNNYKIDKLKNITKLITDGTHQTPTYIDSGYPFLSIKDVSSGKIDFLNVKYISEEEHIALSKSTPVEKGDMIFTRIGTLGVFLIVDIEETFDIFVSLGLIKFNNNIDLVTKEYLKYFFSTVNYTNYINLVKAGGGTTAAKFNLDDVRNSYIILPSIDEQKHIVTYLSKQCVEIDKLIETKESIVDELEQYKKSLIYEYVTGKKEVI